MEKGKGKNADFAERLKEAMADRHWRAVDLCEAAAVPKSAVSYYLAGKSEPKAPRLHSMAMALGVSEAWLMGYDAPKARAPEQKKNDDLARIVVKMRYDSDFFDAVSGLAALSENDFESIKRLVSTLQRQQL